MSGPAVIRLPLVPAARRSGRGWLAASLTSAQRRALTQLTLLWPTADLIAARLAAYLTDAIPAATGPGSLLAVALAQGLRQGRSGDDCARLHGFVRGLLEPLPAVLAWRVRRPNAGAPVWDPLGATDLAEWRRTGPVWVEPWPPAERPAVTPDSVRLKVAARLLDSLDLACLGGDIRAVCDC